MFEQLRNFYKNNKLGRLLVIILSLGLVVLAYSILVVGNYDIYFDILHLDHLITWPLVLAFLIFYNKVFIKNPLVLGIFQGIYFVNLIFANMVATGFGTIRFIITLVIHFLLISLVYIFSGNINDNVESNEVKGSSLMALLTFILPIILLSAIGRLLYQLMYT